MPMNLTAGLRYEKTDVTSSASGAARARASTGIRRTSWTCSTARQGFTTLKGGYHYLLPSDRLRRRPAQEPQAAPELRRHDRASDLDQIQGGQTIDQLVRVDGGTGSQGNPT